VATDVLGEDHSPLRRTGGGQVVLGLAQSLCQIRSFAENQGQTQRVRARGQRFVKDAVGTNMFDGEAVDDPDRCQSHPVSDGLHLEGRVER